MATEFGLIELAERIGGNYWEKGELKRIYLDEGHNTKKMSTKTYVYEKENGSFAVSCKVDCPSQPWQWCKSQEDEVKEKVEERIEQVLRREELELVEFKVLTENTDEIMVYVKEGDAEPVWFTEDDFYENFGCYPDKLFKDVAAAREEQRSKAPETVVSTEQTKGQIDEQPSKSRVDVDESGLEVKAEYAVDARVRHGRFGEGTVMKSDKRIVNVLFDDATVGEKQMLVSLVKMQIL